MVKATKDVEGALTRKVREARRLAVEAFHQSSDYQRDLSEAAVDSFLAGFENYHAKVLWKYLKMDLSNVSLINTPSMPQAMGSPPVGSVEAFIAPSEEDNVVEI